MKLRFGWPLVACAFAFLALVGWGQGLRLADARHETLQPKRAIRLALPADDGMRVPLDRGRHVVVELPAALADARLALHQKFPERTLVRWVEPEAHAPGLLVIPLRGLEPGEYWITRARADERAAPREMDRPDEGLERVGSFVLVDPD